MIHILFPSFLFGIGLIPILFNSKQISAAFFSWTAFAWGTIVWVIAFILCLFLSIPYTLINIMILIVVMLAIAATLLRGKYHPPTRSELATTLPGTITFFVTITIAHLIDLGRGGPDSLVQLIFANELTTFPLSAQTLAEFGHWGVMLAALHAPATWFGYAYFTTIQAAFSITMVGCFGYFCYAGLTQLNIPSSQAVWTGGIVSVFLFSIPFINFQFYYIHNNIAAAMYLLIGVGALWLALTTSSRELHALSVLALLGFGLTRTESVLFAIVFLASALSSNKLSWRDWLVLLLPYTVFLVAWQLWLLFVAQPATHILTPERILILIGVIIGFYLAASMKRSTLLNNLLISHLHQIMILFFMMATVIMLFIDPLNVYLSIQFTFLNLLFEGWKWWGIVWWIVVVWLLSLPYAASLVQERLFVFGILGYFMLVMVVGFAHGPGRLGWYSSPNRLYIHILPIILLYLTLKTAPLMIKEGAFAIEV